MTERESPARNEGAVTLWLDPVCPFSWNTARWLRAAADKAGFDLELRLMSLAVLNEGRELPPKQQARMNDSRVVGRLMAALVNEAGAEQLAAAYFAFGQRYFDLAAPLDAELVTHVTRAVGAHQITAAVLQNADWDGAVRKAHEASQVALGDSGGSPLVTIGGHTIFGPVFSDVPDPARTLTVFDAVVALVGTPEFHQLERPRSH